ncbi:MAG: RipA family octameric membrane protein [Elainellaceae cyanobacterium]
MDKFRQTLFNHDLNHEEVSGNSQIMFEQYKLYVETMEKLVERRQVANSFFLTANAFLITLSGFSIGNIDDSSESSKIFSLIGISISGVLLSAIWLRLNKYYGLMNQAKFSVIHALEKKLPIALFLGEWIALGEGKDPKKYRSMAKVESRVAIIFMLLYLMVGIFAICNVFLLVSG